ncbi:MAG: protein kinase [Firmicutes bacterium]|nr:protein kinase [Bacillota bacterium]
MSGDSIQETLKYENQGGGQDTLRDAPSGESSGGAADCDTLRENRAGEAATPDDGAYEASPEQEGTLRYDASSPEDGATLAYGFEGEQATIAYGAGEMEVTLQEGGQFMLPPRLPGYAKRSFQWEEEFEIRDYLPGETIGGVYEITEKVSEDDYTITYLVRHTKWNRIMELKTLRQKWAGREDILRIFKNECACMIRSGYTNYGVNALYAVLRGNFCGVLSEYFPSVDFTSLYGQNPETVIIRFIQAFSALARFHENGVIHKNLRPSGILIDETGNVRLKDFSFSAGTGEMIVDGKCCFTPSLSPYAPGEIKIGDVFLWGPWSDVYSLGAVMNEILYGKTSSGDETKAEGGEIPNSITAFITKCLSSVHKNRFFDAGEALGELERIFEKAYHKKLLKNNEPSCEKYGDDLNNRAVSMAELGFDEEALAYWTEAAELEPSSLKIRFNRDVFRWRKGLCSDTVVAQWLEEEAKKSGEALLCLAFLNMERDNCREASVQLEKVISDFPGLISGNLSFNIHSLLSYAKLRSPYSTRLLDLEKTETDFPRSLLNSDRKLDAGWDYNGNIYVWDVGDRQKIRTINARMNKTNFAVTTPDDQALIYGGISGQRPTTAVVPLAEGASYPPLQDVVVEQTCIDILFTENFKIAVTGSNGAVVEWDLWSGGKQNIFRGFEYAPNGVAISSDRRFVVAGGNDRILKFYRRGLDGIFALREVHGDPQSAITAVAISPDSRYAASSSLKKDLILWNLETATISKIIKFDSYYAVYMKFSPDGRFIIIRDFQNYIRIIDIGQGRCIRTISGVVGNKFSLRTTESGGFLLTDTGKGLLSAVHIDLPEGGNMPALQLSDTAALDEKKRQSRMFGEKLGEAEKALSDGDTVRAFHLAEEAAGMPPSENDNRLLDLFKKLAPHGRRKSLRKVRFLKAVTSKFTNLQILAPAGDGRSVFITAGNYQGLRLFNTESETFTADYPCEGTTVISALVHPDGRKILSVMNDRKMRLWDIASGRKTAEYAGHTDSIIHTAFSPDGRFLLSGSKDKTVRLWETSSGRCLKVFHFDVPVFSVAFDGGGKNMVLHLSDKTVKFVEIASGEIKNEIQSFWTGYHIPGRYGSIATHNGLFRASDGERIKEWKALGGNRCQISPDSGFFLGYTSGSAVLLWDIDKAEKIYSYEEGTEIISSFCWSDDETAVFSADYGGIIRVWSNEWDYYIPQDEPWEDTVREYIESFLEIHAPSSGNLPPSGEITNEDVRKAFTADGVPYWTGEDFEALRVTLRKAGYGWVAKDSLREKLQQLRDELYGKPENALASGISGDSSVTLSEAYNSSSDQTLAYGQNVSGSDATLAEPLGIQPPAENSRPECEKSEGKEQLPDSVDSGPEWKPGDVIDNLYEISGLIGAGGFGAVYKARHRQWNVDMAVKSLHKQLASRPEQKTAFVRECQGWVNLGLHPNIVSCFYVRDIDGLPRIFSEFMEGGSLEDWMDDSKINGTAQIMDIAFQCLDGLSFAHKKGLVHRDVKPGNCLMTSDGMLKITDFGIASGLLEMGNAGVKPSGAGSIGKTMMTPGGAIGTPAYMPPEQWDRQIAALGPWTDIYAFGVMLFELCCGERPFDEGNEDPSILRIRHLTVDAPAPSEINPDVPEPLSDFILKCLSKETGERFQTCNEARRELERIYEAVTGSEYGRPEPLETDLLSGSLNNRAVSLLDMGMKPEALRSWDEALKADPSNPQVVYNRGVTLWRSGETDDGAILDELNRILNHSPGSADAHYFAGLVLLERDDLNESLKAFEKAWNLGGGMKEAAEGYAAAQVRMPSTGKTASEIPVCRGAYFMDMCLSPDGRFLAVLNSDKQVRVLNLLNGQMIRSIPLTMHGNSLCFSPDGRKMAVGLSDGNIHIFDFQTGQKTKELGKLPYEVKSVSISNTGQYIAACERNNHCAVWDLSAGIILCEFTWYFGPSAPIFWTKDESRLIAFGPMMSSPAGPNLIDISTGRVVKRENPPVIQGIQGIASSAVSADGKTAITGHSEGTYCIWDISSGECIKKFKDREGNGAFSALSSDGKWAYTGGKYLRIWDTASGRCVKTYPSGIIPTGKLIPSPDGTRIITMKMPVFTNGVIGETVVRIIQPGFANFIPSGQPVLSKIVSSAESGQTQNRFNSLVKKAEKALAFRDMGKALELLTEARNIPGYEKSQTGIDLWEKLYPHTRKTGLRGAWISKTLDGHKKNIFCLCIDKTGNRIFSAGLDSRVALWDASGGRLIAEQFYGDTVTKASFSADGRSIIGSSQRGSVRIWDSSNLAIRGILGKSGKSIKDADFSGDGSIAVTAGEGAIVNLWDTSDGRLIRELNINPGIVETADLSTDGKWVLLGTNSIYVKRTDEILTFTMPDFQQDYVKAGHFGSDGATVFAGVLSSTLYVYDVMTQRVIHKIGGFSKIASEIAVGDDNRWVLGGMDNFSLWDMAAGRTYRILEHNPCGPVAVTPDGRVAVCSGGDMKIKVWNLDWELEYPQDRSIDDGVESYIRTWLSSVRKPVPDGETGFYLSLAELNGLKEILGNGGFGWVNFPDVTACIGRIFTEEPGKGKPVKSSLLTIIEQFRSGKIKPHSSGGGEKPAEQMQLQTKTAPMDISKAAGEIIARMKPVSVKPERDNSARQVKLPAAVHSEKPEEMDSQMEKPEEKKSWLSKIIGKFIK